MRVPAAPYTTLSSPYIRSNIRGLPCSYPVASSPHRRNAATTRPTDTIHIPAGSRDCELSHEPHAEALGPGTKEIFTKVSWYDI